MGRAAAGAVELVGRPGEGRSFGWRRRVRLGDVDPTGCLRLDAVARFLQDVANDDVLDTGVDPDMAWVVRRTLVEVRLSPRMDTEVELVTWCSGIGGRWAERRTSITGPSGASIEAAMVWVFVDPGTSRPLRLSADFDNHYLASTSGRTVRASLLHDDPPEEVVWRSWPMRAVDFDVLGHANNAAYWCAVEEVLQQRGRPETVRVSMEYRRGIALGSSVEVGVDRDEGWPTALWFRTNEGVVASAHIARVTNDIGS